MAVHPKVEEAFDEIDAMMFTGCPSTEDLNRLQYFIDRWTRNIPSAREFNDEHEGSECPFPVNKDML